jgi:hypothetical protein
VAQVFREIQNIKGRVWIGKKPFEDGSIDDNERLPVWYEVGNDKQTISNAITKALPPLAGHMDFMPGRPSEDALEVTPPYVKGGTEPPLEGETEEIPASEMEILPPEIAKLVGAGKQGV